MRTFNILFTLYLLLPGKAISQQEYFFPNDEEVLDSILTWKFNGQGDSTLAFRETHHYDSQARLTGQFEYLTDPAIHVWVPYRKMEYAFDTWGNQTLWSVMYYESEYGAFTGLSRTETVFNAGGQKVRETWYGWDLGNMTWANPTQTDYEYNENDSLSWTYTRHLDSETGIWDSTAKGQYLYQADGKLLQFIEWEPDYETQILYPTLFHDYEYNNAGDRILEIVSYFNNYNGVYYPVNKSETAFNNFHQRTQFIYYEYNEEDEYWWPEERYDFDWSAAGSMIYYAYYRIDEDTSWAPYRKEEMTYSTTNQILSDIYYSGTNAGEWQALAKRQYQYSMQDLLAEETYFIRDTLANAWIENNRHEYAYDSESRTYSDTYYAYINITHQIELVTRDYYYYSVYKPWGVREKATDLFVVYPNPATDRLKVQGLPAGQAGLMFKAGVEAVQLELIDISGRQVMSRVFHHPGNDPLEMDVSMLKPGMYLLNIRSGIINSTQKIIIQK